MNDPAVLDWLGLRGRVCVVTGAGAGVLVQTPSGLDAAKRRRHVGPTMRKPETA